MRGPVGAAVFPASHPPFAKPVGVGTRQLGSPAGRAVGRTESLSQMERRPPGWWAEQFCWLLVSSAERGAQDAGAGVGQRPSSRSFSGGAPAWAEAGRAAPGERSRALVPRAHMQSHRAHGAGLPPLPWAGHRPRPPRVLAAPGRCSGPKVSQPVEWLWRPHSPPTSRPVGTCCLQMTRGSCWEPVGLLGSRSCPV